MVQEIRYTEDIETFVNNGNAQWLEDIREDKVAVTYYLDRADYWDSEMYEWTIHLQFLPGEIRGTLTLGDWNLIALRYLESRVSKAFLTSHGHTQDPILNLHSPRLE